MKLDTSTGDSLWSFQTQRGGFYRMRPVIENGVVYAGTTGGYGAFFAVDAQTGTERWRNTDAYTYAGLVTEDAIFINDSVNLQRLDKQSGRTIWKTDLGAGSGESGLAYLDGYVYHPHGGALFVVDAETGEVMHIEATPDGSYFWEVGVGDGKVFAQTSSLLVAYEPFQPR